MPQDTPQYKLAGTSNFAFVYAFISTFQPILGTEPVEPEVAIIKWLCEHMLDCNEYLHRTIDSHVNMPKRGKGSDNFRPSFIRLEPYAVDSLRRQYWLLGNESRFMYRETNPGSGRASWELVATSVPQFRSISDQLKRTRTKINKAIASSIDTEIIPLLERRAKRIEQREKAMRRNMDLFSNVQILESRTRKRKNVNYNVDDMDVDFEEDPLYYTAA
ncbi:hypothetical protein EV182_003427 [Spiromyces aspiralis]|uniref:Uncharacterized protein n=1 Tax=Spiromyces aspiralis TaxID=68401 RepID=A0ACC1HGM1_9FUNG|nr:hypothetical protein EV182_003427 [Spiromyces aspiralis]